MVLVYTIYDDGRRDKETFSSLYEADENHATP